VRFAWAVLAFNLLVVLWGALVRATGSGAGCGGHWPLCNGELVPRAPAIETLIEFTLRAMSALSLASVAALCIWAFRRFPRGSRVRKVAALSAAFLCIQALLGAGLVLFDYVAHNVSVGRAFYLALSLANTQVLLAALTATPWLASQPENTVAWRRAPRAVLAALPLTVPLGMTGAIAALGDTLFPAISLKAGLAQDFSAAASLLVRLRSLHPLLAVAIGVFVFYAASSAMKAQRGARALAAGTRADRRGRGQPGPARAGVDANPAPAGGGPALDRVGPAGTARRLGKHRRIVGLCEFFLSSPLSPPWRCCPSPRRNHCA
jgi:cytochrome c oxidase assembly protein subunit 15